MPDFPYYPPTGGDEYFYDPRTTGAPPQPQPTDPGYPPTGAPPDTLFPGGTYTPPPPTIAPEPSTPSTPSPSTPPPADAPVVGSDPFYGVLGGPLAWLYRSRKVGRRIPSPLETMVRTGVSELFKNARDYLRPGRVIDFAPPAPPGKPPDLYRPDIFRPPPAPLLPFVLSRLTALGALLYPSPLGVGTLTPGERANERVRATYDAGNFRMLGLPEGPAPKFYTDPRRVPDMLLESIPRPAVIDYSLQGWLKRYRDGTLEPFTYDKLLEQIPGLPRPSPSAREQRAMGPPEPQVNIADIRTPAQQQPQVSPITPAQTTQQSTQSSSGFGRKMSRGAQRAVIFGGLGAAVLLGGLVASRRGRATNPLVAGSPGPIVSPPSVAPIVPAPLTPQQPTVQSYYFGGASGGSSDGYCVPKPRGPRRKCLERAPVKYSGGRRKGKSAGTKCLRWEGGKR